MGRRAGSGGSWITFCSGTVVVFSQHLCGADVYNQIAKRGCRVVSPLRRSEDLAAVAGMGHRDRLGDKTMNLRATCGGRQWRDPLSLVRLL